MKLTEFETKEQLEAHLESGVKLNNIVFQSMDLSEYHSKPSIRTT